jgi:hypothetical protein
LIFGKVLAYRGRGVCELDTIGISCGRLSFYCRITTKLSLKASSMTEKHYFETQNSKRSRSGITFGSVFFHSICGVSNNHIKHIASI